MESTFIFMTHNLSASMKFLTAGPVRDIGIILRVIDMIYAEMSDHLILVW